MAKARLGASVDYFYYENIPQAQYLKFLEDIVKRGYDIVVVVNFMMTEQVAELADKYPNQKFAILDAVVEGKPNVMSIVFRENEGLSPCRGPGSVLNEERYRGHSARHGYTAPMEVRDRLQVGGSLRNERDGRKLKILWEYVGTFGNPNKGKETATLMLQQGADIIYHAAGETGLGVLDAVYEYSQKSGKTMYAIGVDAPQERVHPGFIVASMVKHVEVAVYKAIEDVARGVFKGGLTALGIKEGGVDISKPDDIRKMIDIAVELNLMSKDVASKVFDEIMKLRGLVPKDVWDKVMGLRESIISGKVEVPPTDG